MKLEDQVTSLEISKKLKELGVKQESLFYYQNNPYNDGKECIDLMIKKYEARNNENSIINTQCDNEDNPKFSAFTVAELGEILNRDLIYGDYRTDIANFSEAEFRGIAIVNILINEFCRQTIEEKWLEVKGDK
jgi:hypothetical protein